jgi:hypothetical protein
VERGSLEGTNERGYFWWKVREKLEPRALIPI